MSYPVWTDPTDWDESKHAAFKARIMEGCAEETPEIQAAWSTVADSLIAAADAFKLTVSVGITQVIMQAENEAHENEQYLNFRVVQRVLT